MKTFLIKAFLSAIPLLVVYLFPLAVYFLSRDYASVNTMIKTQSEKPNTLVGFSYFGEANVVYKELLVEKVTPDVIALGSSRTFHTRKEFFRDSEKFVNAAVTRNSLGNLINMENFIRKLPDDGKQRLVTILLDRRFFTERYESGSDRNSGSFVLKFLHLSGKPLRLLYLDYFKNAFSFRTLIKESKTSSNIGLWALVKDSGYRQDGSYREGHQMNIPNRKEVLKSDVETRVRDIRNYDQLVWKKEEAAIVDNLKELGAILALCKEKGIIVVGYIPPDPEGVSEAFAKNDSSYAQAQNALKKDIASVFSEHGSIFFDLSDISLFGGKNDEFIDMIHGGDLLYARVYLYMAHHNKTLARYINAEGLERMIREAKSDFLDF